MKSFSRKVTMLIKLYNRLDAEARDIWSSCERTLADVRIFNPNSESYLAQTSWLNCIFSMKIIKQAVPQ